MHRIAKIARLCSLCWLAWAAAPAHAQLLPPVSYVGTSCGVFNGIYTDAGPAGAGLQLSCDKQESGVSLRYGPYTFEAVASVNTGLEKGGAVDAGGSLKMTGGEPYLMWSAGAGGYIRYQVGLAGLGAAPQDVQMVPIKFRASGEAHVNGGDMGSFDIAAWVGDQGWRRQWEGAGSNSGSFSGTTSVMLSTGANQAMEVLVSAWCHVSTWSGGAGSGNCVAAADPIFSFDQPAFDTLMGANSFALDQYYRIDLSPGVTAVPEPATAWMALAGGLALVWRRRRAGNTA